MRLFVAVDLDDTLRREAARAARAVRTRLERADIYGVSWVAAENLHVTLRFLGEVSDDLGRRVERGFAEPFVAEPFELELAGAGTFPPSGAARVIWLGITRGAEHLARLHEDVEARLQAFPFEKEERAFRAHLTIARFRSPAPARVRETISASVAGPVGRCTVRDVTLYRSQLSPKGAVYTRLARAPLAGASS